MARGLAAVTGATGFLGRHLVKALAEDGWDVRILARRDPVHPSWRELEPQVVIGGLDDTAALARLCDGADSVIHAAGLIKARNGADFSAVNVAGVERLAKAAAPGAGFLLISSLAAREPKLSAYAASKRAGEEAARRLLGERLTIARPTAIYGPGDLETLRLFRAAATSPVLPVFDPAARITLAHVEDVARHLAALAARPKGGGVYALCDARREGYGWAELMAAAAAACGSKPLLARLPAALASAVAVAVFAIQRAGGGTPMVSPGKLREILHRDWSVGADELDPDAPVPRFDLSAGMRHTVRWYRESGFLPRDSRQFGDGVATGI